MAKKETEKSLTVVETPTTFGPAPIVGVQSNFEIPKAALPKEFQGQELETLDTGFPPTVKWVNPGNFVAGVFEGTQEEIGPNKSKLYNFDAKGKKFSVWGTTTLDRVFASGQIEAGDMVLITYMGDLPTDMNPCKLFDVKVVRGKK